MVLLTTFLITYYKITTMASLNLESTRKYTITEAGENLIQHISYNQTLEQILSNQEDQSETNYSLQERIDEVLDLKVGQSIYFTPSRDQVNSKGVITRIR